jgi:hypothetical protein
LQADWSQVFNTLKLSHEQQGGMKMGNFTMITAGDGLICCGVHFGECLQMQTFD